MTLRLSDRDREDLEGVNGPAAQWAMTLLAKSAEALGATSLVDIASAHCVGSYHSGPANMALLERLVGEGARVRVPTSLNATSADVSETAHTCFHGQDAEDARRVIAALCAMGARPTLTCAPYFLDVRPKRGEHVAWAESNAVLFANAVIGARTLKTPQYLDLACALTGRAPLAGPMTDAGRRPQVVIDVSGVSARWFSDDVGFELLGLLIGRAVGARTPFLQGLAVRPDELGLRSLCAAVGAAGDGAMLHVDGVTPEADQARVEVLARGLDAKCVRFTDADLHACAAPLRPAGDTPVAAVCVGAPHAGPADLARIAAALGDGEHRLAAAFYVSIPRDVAAADPGGVRARLEAAGVTFVRDACTYYGPLLARTQGVVATTSAKWAAYAPATLPCRPALATLGECVDAARTGHLTLDRSVWDG